jgi:hypothetical protein
LTPLSALLGAVGDAHRSATSDGEPLIVMGMLSQLQEGKFYLEDLDGKVRVDLSRTNFTMGLFTEQCVVISEGKYRDQVFHATSIGFPPPEPRSVTLRVSVFHLCALAPRPGLLLRGWVRRKCLHTSVVHNKPSTVS